MDDINGLLRKLAAGKITKKTLRLRYEFILQQRAVERGSITKNTKNSWSLGRNNKLIPADGLNEYIKDGFYTVSGLKLRVLGNNNTIKIGPDLMATNSALLVDGNDCLVEIGAEVLFQNFNMAIYSGTGAKLTIKDRAGFMSGTIGMSMDAECTIGEDCRIGNELLILCDDGHAITDRRTGKILNEAKGTLSIGNHCLVGRRATITKSARIADNTIVGMGSVIAKKFNEQYTIIAGNPAKVIKRGIEWHDKDISELAKEEPWRLEKKN